MSAREFFNNNPAIVTGGAVLVLVVCLAAIACSLFGGFGGGGSSSVQLVYYDMGTNTVKLISSSERPGSPLVDNDQAYRCFVLACGECGDIKDGMTREELQAEGMFISHLQTFPTNDGRMEPIGMGEDNTQVLMLAAENPMWYGIGSPQGSEIMQTVYNWQCEDGTTAKPCQP